MLDHFFELGVRNMLDYKGRLHRPPWNYNVKLYFQMFRLELFARLSSDQ